jgi:hypothetical protein
MKRILIVLSNRLGASVRFRASAAQQPEPCPRVADRRTRYAPFELLDPLLVRDVGQTLTCPPPASSSNLVEILPPPRARRV